MRSSERGAVVILVAVCLLGLMAFSAIVIDYGLLWVARTQAQTSADAGALAGALALSFDNPTDRPGAAAKAAALANANWVFGQAPGVTTADVSFLTPAICKPPAYLGNPDTCVRVAVDRTVAKGNPLPTFFANLQGSRTQGVRATATAQVFAANGTNCLKPFMIPDKWAERTAPATTFNGSDFYTPPDATGQGGTGYGLQDIGTVVVFHPGRPQDAINPSDYYDVDLDGTGGANFRTNIATCTGVEKILGDTLTVFPGSEVGPTRQGIRDLVALDPNASWNGSAVVNSCCSPSPRIVPIAMFSPAAYAAQDRQSGRFNLTIVNIMGFFVQGISGGGDVTGVLMALPGDRVGPGPASPFLNTVILVR